MATFPAREDAGDRKPVSREAALALITWSRNIGLNPWLGDTCYYYGKPYITEGGSIKLAKMGGQYDGHYHRSLTTEEMGFLHVTEEDYAVACVVVMKDQEKHVVDYGILRLSEIKEAIQQYGIKAAYLPVVKRPETIALARATRRAHLKAAGGTWLEEEGGVEGEHR